MKLAFINGSPKAKDSASECILKTLKNLINHNEMISEYNFRKPHLDNKEIDQICQCNVMVIAFPLYVDGIPAHLVRCLYEMGRFLKTCPNPNIKVYAIVNCGFYEGNQNSIALEMVENWCEKCGISFGQGIGIGGGGMLPVISNVPDGKGPKKKSYEALKNLSNNISTNSSGENIFISPSFPRFAYKLSAEAGWRQKIKSNGLSRKDLFLRK
jgi:multimeric flavodoxin WrbA